MSHRREVVIGHTVLGRSIEAVHFTPPSYARERPPALLFGAIHGDEAVTQLMLERLADELVERPPGRDTWIVPCVNVDGVLAGTRNNANDVDLNRNFASASWGTQRRPGYHPGKAAEDQPETQAIVALIERTGAHRLIAVHATYRMINWDGGGEPLAHELAERCGYPVERDMGYPTPGSFGTKYGVEQQREVVTFEVPYLGVDERAWTDCRTALRWCVDLPA
ncbi:MAG: succinylglutamate desuccinylase/aspartoacylase family protein [Deltaproteobacteria bacterium]|nr:succinylglutamate desuccinylase/aspartoacylase family protein [Deltaproteobacteria bacterium]MCW5807857.1 succinylglutamate desuccinylase/aspartoacylase family protein [Deltaproteobacteria bacterium]